MSTLFVKTDEPGDVVQKVVGAIREALQAGRRVAWLVSGGSLIPLEVMIMRELNTEDCAGLAVLQVDERYGPDGHADGNWQRLLDAGFDGGTAYCLPALCGLPFDETVERYDALMKRVLEADDVFCIGLFGMGADGHTAGILPGSSAAESGADLVVGYEGPDFTRVTSTPAAIARLDLAIAYAVGDTKAEALERLQQSGSATEQPAQFLKQAKETLIYNDHLEGSV